MVFTLHKKYSLLKATSVVMIGDSHTRGCTTKVKGNLNDNFVVNGFVKPGACIDITSTINGDGEQFTKRDVVFWEVPMIQVKITLKMG
jgi:hypothetical protein